MNKLSKAISLALQGSTIALAISTNALAGTTMYNTYGNFGTTPCAPCFGPQDANPAGGNTTGWIYGTSTAAGNYSVASPGPGQPTLYPWVGTSSANATPFSYYGSATLNWAIQLNSTTDSAEISNADSLNRYGVSAALDTAKGSWEDNGATTPGQPTGWLHSLNIGLFMSTVTTTVELSAYGVNDNGGNSTGDEFGFTIFKGMDTSTDAYVHHGAWNTSLNGTPIPPGTSFTTADMVATTDMSGSTPVNLNNIEFTAQAGQVYTIYLGGVNGGDWYTRTDGYVMNATAVGNPAAVPVPGAVWLFGSALLGMLGLKRNRLH